MSELNTDQTAASSGVASSPTASASLPSSTTAASSSNKPHPHEMIHICIPMPEHASIPRSIHSRDTPAQEHNPYDSITNTTLTELTEMQKRCLKDNHTIMTNQVWLLIGQIGIMILVIVAVVVITQDVEKN
ncbi:uncharacterized protein BP01DRAFT_388234 [Aspergillus saccharolyticus JOP 1030-1]|uniref:Uncharacterized protein n=1 Tax=Aspergillus saccharolyticus JOP 1030-1 TaxID=1450539 RepID=A0A318ZY75_9EURO|nr:hypothetical protein BP01DRAFT_388234 [Aspergillus saccharolyticus JOP 1030-1]PYH49150.1 hypothetical protein BP01DRAFT_388234 [Aspergillus saccharolyticus JOP 1030-1]